MKKLLTLFAVFALVGITFVACEKDDEESASNSITITGTFNVGEKEFTNPTFNLGEPDEHQGYTVTFIEKNVYNGIIIEPTDLISLGNNLYLYYKMEIYTAQPGTTTMYCNVSIYEGFIDKKFIADFYVVSQDANVTINKVGALGEYIEGTYEGDFYVPTKAELPPYQIKGKFKVKRIAQPVPVK
ncbi:MAG TPA: hypothetical protein P5145_06315 [Tenuifilaceae bacterium]|nr:hypothetical protein [Tenuifilaceae bacterium]